MKGGVLSRFGTAVDLLEFVLYMDRLFPTLEIDYDEHPAFRRLARIAHWNEGQLEAWIHEIDHALETIERLQVGGREVELQFRDAVLPKIDALAAHVDRQLPGSALRESVASAFKLCANEILLDLRCKNARHLFDNRPLIGPRELPCYESVSETGLAIAKANPDDLRELQEHIRAEREAMRRESDANLVGRNVHAYGQYDPAARLAAAILRKTGIWGAAEKYKQLRLELAYCALELSTERQTWYRDCYADVGLPTSDTAYVHYDGNFSVIKALIYLNDVGLQTGPFRYNSRSLKWKRSVFTNTLLVHLDHAFGERRYHGYGGTYYRPRFKLPSARSDFVSLPRCFRSSSHFGDDLLNGSPMSKRLLEAERPVTGPLGTCILFDGYGGLHRGGLVAKGERWVINVGLQAEAANRPAQRARRKLRDGLVRCTRVAGVYSLLKKLQRALS